MPINYTRPFLYPKQEKAFFTPHRFSYVEASTKAGKTVSAIAWIVEQALFGKANQNFWWVAPVSDQAKIAFTRVKNNLTPGSFTAIESPTPKIKLINQTHIWFKSGDNADCFDSQTEILTNKGWKLFKFLDKTEDVLTLNPDTLKAEWQKPKRYIAQEYSGRMFRVSSGKLNLLVTPNHRFFVKLRSGGDYIGRPVVKKLKWPISAKRAVAREKLILERQLAGQRSAYRFKTIEEISKSPRDTIPARVGWEGSDLTEATEDVCALLGIYLAEGCTAGAFGGTAALANGDYTVHFSQSPGIKGGIKGDVRAQLKELFQRLGLLSVKETEEGFFIRSKELWKIFSKLGNCYSKFIPERIKELPPAKLEVLLHWMLLGDGTIRYSNTNSVTTEKTYYSTSRQLADDVQEIAIKAGYSAIVCEKKQVASMLADGRIIEPTHFLWQVNIVHSAQNYFCDSEESYISEETYNGMVYCVETDNSTVLVRRHGKVCWSGNSLYGEDVFAAIIDEASRVKEDAFIALRSTLTATQGPLRCIGNVKGRKNWFYRMARMAESGNHADMNYIKITVLDAVAAGVIPQSEIETAKRDLPEQAFRELYMAEAADDGGNPFGLDHILECVSRGLSRKPPVAYGIDLAKKNDYLVVIGLDEDGSVSRFLRWKGIPWRASIQRIHEEVGEDVPALVDSTGVGDPVLEELQVGHGNFKGYNFSQVSKQRLMEGLAVSIQSHEVSYPDGPIPRELESYEYEYTRTGVRYTAPEGMHDDCVCSLALAREQWSTAAPGLNLMQYYSDTAQKRLRETETETFQGEKFFPFGRKNAEPEGAFDNELTELYNQTLKGYAPQENLCKGCGKEIAGRSRVTDGFSAWHVECSGFGIRTAA